MIDLDPTNLREWMAAVGLLRLVSATTEQGRLVWQFQSGRYRLEAADLPADMAERCAAWVIEHRSAWTFAGHQNMDFDAATWRECAAGAQGLEASLWCAIASDGVPHPFKPRLRASGLEYGHGGGHQHWLSSMRSFLESAAGPADLARVLSGIRDETMKGPICRWDYECERSHAYRDKAPTDDKMTQDQTINALAAIGLASCPSAPSRRGLVTPLIKGDAIFWPVWTVPLRIAELDAALCCGWSWPTMRSRRWQAGKLYCFSRGELCEPVAGGI